MTGVEEDKMLTVRGTSRSSIWSSYKAIVRNSFVSIVDRMCDPFTTQIIRNQQKGAQALFSQAFLSMSVMRQYSEPESRSCRHREFSAGQARMKATYQQAAIAAIPPARIQTQSGQLWAPPQRVPEKRVAFVSSSGLHREFWPAYWRSGTLSLPRTRPHSCQQTWKPGWAWLARLFRGCSGPERQQRIRYPARLRRHHG